MSEQGRTSVTANGMLWLGAAIGIAEIFTGTLFAPLGWQTGILAIVIGHLIGGVMLFLVGRIGAQTGRTAMETLKIAFGEKGGLFFAVLNVLQLLGWTAVMIVSGASAINVLFGRPDASVIGGCVFIGLLIAVWLMYGPHSFGRVNSLVVLALAALCVFLSYRIATTDLVTSQSFEAISFGAAVELAVAMPLSWLPVIADYTSRAEKPVLSNTVSNISYFIGSCWMYTIGMGAAISTGYTDLSMLMQMMGFGIIGLGIIVFSTVTTTFLDARSAAISFRSINGRLAERPLALLGTAIGTLVACFVPMTSYESFLYLIGSCFTPMVGVLLAEYYLLNHKEVRQAVNGVNFIIWCLGFIIYRVVLGMAPVTGITLPVVLLITLLTFVVHRVLDQQGQASGLSH